MTYSTQVLYLQLLKGKINGRGALIPSKEMTNIWHIRYSFYKNKTKIILYWNWWKPFKANVCHATFYGLAGRYCSNSLFWKLLLLGFGQLFSRNDWRDPEQQILKGYIDGPAMAILQLSAVRIRIRMDRALIMSPGSVFGMLIRIRDPTTVGASCISPLSPKITHF